MKNETRLTHREDESARESPSVAAHSRSQGPLEFATPEEALRHDRQHTEVPPSVAQRLAASLAAEPTPPPPGWWRRWFHR